MPDLENAVIHMSNNLGKIQGSLEAIQEDVGEIKERMRTDYKDLNGRVTVLETAKTRLLTIAAVISGITGTMVQFGKDFIKP